MYTEPTVVVDGRQSTSREYDISVSPKAYGYLFNRVLFAQVLVLKTYRRISSCLVHQAFQIGLPVAVVASLAFQFAFPSRFAAFAEPRPFLLV